MKLLDTIIFSLAILFMLVGLHQGMTVSYAASYWLFMLAMGMLLWYQYRKKNRKKEEETAASSKEGKNTESPVKKRKYKI